MTSEQVMARLREHEAELRKAGIVRLWLFGSTARGDRQPESDTDLLAALDETRGLCVIPRRGARPVRRRRLRIMD